MKIQLVSRIKLLSILLFSCYAGFAQADSARLDQKAMNYFDSIALKMDSVKTGRKMIFSIGSKSVGSYDGTATIVNEEDRAVIISVAMEFFKLSLKGYGYKGKTIKILENQTCYYHAGTLFFDSTGLRVESKEVLARLKEYSEIYTFMLPIYFPNSPG